MNIEDIFKDFEKKYNNIESEDWIPIFEKQKINDEVRHDIYGFSALIDNNSEGVRNCLESYEWGFSPLSFGKSTFEKVITSDSEKIYFISGNKTERYEYLVAHRDFSGKYDSVIEINPILIWYGNLVMIEDKYIDPLTDDVKIKTERNKILVLKSYLKDFLAAHNKCCIIAFDHRRFFEANSKTSHEVRDVKFENGYYVIVTNSYEYNSYNAMGSILGKVVLKPYATPKHQDYIYLTEKKRYIDFIIGEVIETGEEVSFTCEENRLANYFGANPNAPHFLTPVYFNRNVLDKYTNDPANFKVGDGIIMFLDQWSIPFTINDDNKVVVWLGDLGRLPYSEQCYWKVYNIKPQGGIEKKFFQRQIMAKFTDSITPEKKLFELIADINSLMLEKFGDKIFNDLSDADKQIESAFSIPTNNSITTYQTYLMQLSKIIVESINTKLIKMHLPANKLLDENKKTLGSRIQLKLFLDEMGLKGNEKLDKILKIIYNSRNKLAGHKGSIQEYNKIWSRQVNYKPDFISDSKIILTTLNNALNDLIEELN